MTQHFKVEYKRYLALTRLLIPKLRLLYCKSHAAAMKGLAFNSSVGECSQRDVDDDLNAGLHRLYESQ